MPTTTDIAWAAGFLEGEGCFAYYRDAHNERRTSGTLFVGACQCNREPLDKLADFFGGPVRLVRSAKGVKRPVWDWRIGGKAAEEAMVAVVPYMSERRRQQIADALVPWMQRRIDRALRDITKLTECVNGHPWDLGKWSMRRSGKNTGARICHLCLYEQRRKKKEATA